MKAKEMRERTRGELLEMERDLTRDLWKTRFQNFTNQLDDTARIRRLRRDISRVKTLLAQGAGQSADAQQD
ncbi:MAG: 50S ribosomal protein L29 [Myxococcales bacterium]|nr:50S ribosomal protein L29 [Myxococcales bacterium]